MGTYVAIKSGEQYILQPKSSLNPTNPTLVLVGGIAALHGLLRGGLLGVGFVGLGVIAISSGIKGSDTRGASIFKRRPRGVKSAGTPSHHQDYKRRVGQRPADEVEEASMESFPASDAPTFTKTEMTR